MDLARALQNVLYFIVLLKNNYFRVILVLIFRTGTFTLCLCVRKVLFYSLKNGQSHPHIYECTQGLKIVKGKIIHLK